MSEQKLNREQRRAKGKKKPAPKNQPAAAMRPKKPWHTKQDPFHLGRLVG